MINGNYAYFRLYANVLRNFVINILGWVSAYEFSSVSAGKEELGNSGDSIEGSSSGGCCEDIRILEVYSLSVTSS